MKIKLGRPRLSTIVTENNLKVTEENFISFSAYLYGVIDFDGLLVSSIHEINQILQY